MSFSSDVKNELARLEGLKPCCQKAELLGVLRMSGAIVLRGMNMGIHFSTENAALARRVLQMLKSNYKVRTEIVVTRSRRLKKNNRYQVEVLPDPEVAKALKELRILPSEEAEGEPKDVLLRKSCCRRSFLRGVFMAGGSISRPSSDYHLEIVTENQEFARLILKIMHGFQLNARMTDRKNDFIVYLKDGDHIIDFLSVIGAHQALMEFENVRIIKDMRNNEQGHPRRRAADSLYPLPAGARGLRPAAGPAEGSGGLAPGPSQCLAERADGLYGRKNRQIGPQPPVEENPADC